MTMRNTHSRVNVVEKDDDSVEDLLRLAQIQGRLKKSRSVTMEPEMKLHRYLQTL